MTATDTTPNLPMATTPPPTLKTPAALAPHMLYRSCDPTQLDFDTTASLLDAAAGGGAAEAAPVIGQARAREAARYAAAMRAPGYNLFVMGEPGSGRHTLMESLLRDALADRPPAEDWCYVNNFDDADQPRLLRLPAGRGAALRRDMQRFVDELPTAITAAFETDDYRNRVEAEHDALKAREESALNALNDEAAAHQVVLVRSPRGFLFAPLSNGEPMGPEQFNALPEADQAHYRDLLNGFGERLQQVMRQFPKWRRETQAQIKQISRETMQLAVGHLIEELKEHYADLAAVQDFLDGVMTDVMEMGDSLRAEPRSEGDGVEVSGSISVQRYLVNLLVDRDGSAAPPQVYEDHPSFTNLVGRVDQVAHMGTLVTNFTMIRAGALHRANGGVLLLDIDKVLSQPYAWEGLKRALKAQQIRIESLSQAFGLAGSPSLEPAPVPLSVKVVLFGERLVYYLLQEYDPEFAALFKIAADFDDDVPRDADHTRQYARLIATLARDQGLRPFQRAAVARIIEHGARLAEDAERLSTATRLVGDVMREADHLASNEGTASVSRDHVIAALAARQRRAGRIRENVQRAITQGTLIVDTTGEAVGEVNGLVVTGFDDQPFGHPVRITATVRLGDGDVIDIERETDLGGPNHSKGVLILASFLAARYGRGQPLSLGASLVFEQSYGPVEGDSASLGELCALLSAIASKPVRQSLAITGSINQHGQVQPIGGVNEKIEGFFDLCAARGLSGDQGVLIPARNVGHLMLKEEVVAACAAGRFHIYPVDDVDQAIELLTGTPIGEPNAEGLIPEGSINFLVATQLSQMTALGLEFGGGNRIARHRHKRK